MISYIIPQTELVSMTAEHAVLTASEIPMGGETGHFDTRAQYDWTDDWDGDAIIQE